MARVALFHGPGQPFEMATFPVPVPVGSEILVRVLCCTLCTSDLHTHAGRRHGPTPAVLGHEIVGRVESLGPEVPRHSVAVGERITWSIAASCGSCFYCGEGLPQKCERLHKYGHERSTSDRPFTGGLADFILLAPGTATRSVPDEVPDGVAALANCATATAVALIRTAGKLADRTVVILGAGVLGVTVAALARSANARHVVVCDPDPTRRDRAREFGATRTISTDPIARDQLLGELTERRRADVVVECAGTEESVASALSLVRVGGTVILAGTVRPTRPVPLDPEKVVRELLTIRGVHNYTPDDLHQAMAFLAGAGRAFPFASLVVRTFRLDEVEQAFADGHRHPGWRIAVFP